MIKYELFIGKRAAGVFSTLAKLFHEIPKHDDERRKAVKTLQKHNKYVSLHFTIKKYDDKEEVIVEKPKKEKRTTSSMEEEYTL